MNRLIITIVAFFGAVGLMVSFVLPKYEQFQQNQQDIARKKDDLQIKDAYIADLTYLSSEIEKYSKEIAKVDTALPSDPSFPLLFNFFQKVSANNGLILKSMNVDLVSTLPQKQEGEEADRQSKVQGINIQLTVTGSYVSFKNFLTILEKSARLIEVENVSFSSIGKEEGGEEEEESGFSFNLTLKTQSY